MGDINATRRSAIKGLLAISAAGALASCGSKAEKSEAKKGLGDTEFASFKGFFTEAEMSMLTALSATIIPKTDTAGAVEAGVPEQLQSLATVWGDDDYRRYWRQGLRALSAKLPDFLENDAAAKETQLSAYDAKVFGGGLNDRFYRDMKTTIATAYYMSEPGATEELAYEPVPGEWKGCVPLADYPKTWAT